MRADIVYGRDGRSRGYGTVRYETAEEAEAAIEQFNGELGLTCVCREISRLLPPAC